MPKIVSFGKIAVRETLLGKRGIVKESSLWLPLALIIQCSTTGDDHTDLLKALYVVGAVLCWGTACILANDRADKRDDRATGKKRWICSVSHNASVSCIIIIFVAGCLFIVSAKGRAGIILPYATAYIIGLLYSIKPFRFKERGILGLAAYSISSAIGYVFVPWLCYDSGMLLLVLLFIAVMLDKWVNLHFHQIVDFRNDSTVKTGTFAVRVGKEDARRTLQAVSNLASLSFIAVVAFIIVYVTHTTSLRVIILLLSVSILAVTGIYKFLATRQSSGQTDLVNELPWIYLGLTYLLFRVLPPIILAMPAFLEPAMWMLVFFSCMYLIGESSYALKYQYE